MAPKNIIFESIIGSHAYGLQTPDSDKDLVGLFIAPTLEIAGLNWSRDKTVWSTTGPGKQDDFTYYELSHLFGQILKGNPNSLEMISADYKNIHKDYELVYWLEDNINNIFGAEQVRESMRGFLFSIINELTKSPKYNYKSVRTALIKSAGVKFWLTTGKYRFDSFSNNKANFTNYLQNADKEDMIDLLDSEMYQLQHIKAASFLREKSNESLITETLKKVRKDNL